LRLIGALGLPCATLRDICRRHSADHRLSPASRRPQGFVSPLVWKTLGILQGVERQEPAALAIEGRQGVVAHGRYCGAVEQYLSAAVFDRLGKQAGHFLDQNPEILGYRVSHPRFEAGEVEILGVDAEPPNRLACE